MPSIAKAAPSRPAHRPAPKPESKAPAPAAKPVENPKQAISDKEKTERALRRAISEKASRLPDGTHPFGRRNRLLIDARKLTRVGNRQEAEKLIAQASSIAPLTKAEIQKVYKP